MAAPTATPGLERFQQLVATVAKSLDGRALDAGLAVWLNQHYGADSAWYTQMHAACASGVAQGWLCQRENAGIRWGRVFEAGPALGGFSVDVVQMKDLAGPHHTHPLGEIDLILPITPGALFDGHPAGWCVYGPGSAHRPTVSQGEAWVLYLLPAGQIQFTRAAA
jgi:hypothetical protein